MSEGRSVKPARARWSTSWGAGCAPRWRRCRASPTRRAILYALKLWLALALYCDDSAIEIVNSAAERALRGVAIGRRNCLFAGTDSGGERATAIYSLIGTAKLNGVDPEAWLRYVLARIADHPVNRGRRTSYPGIVPRRSHLLEKHAGPQRGDVIIGQFDDQLKTVLARWPDAYSWCTCWSGTIMTDSPG